MPLILLFGMGEGGIGALADCRRAASAPAVGREAADA